MDEPLRILIVEDEPADAELVERELRKAGLLIEAHRVETREGLAAALDSLVPDLVVSDYTLPTLDGMEALRLTLARAPLTPVIMVTGSLNEEVAVACMKAGAADYVLKDRMARLGPAVVAAMDRRRSRQEAAAAEAALRESEDRYHNVFAIAGDAMFLLDHATGAILDANAAATRLYGYTREELLQLRNVDLSAEPAATARALQEALQFAPVRYHRTKGGAVIPVEISASYYAQAGRGVSVVSIRDISQRLATEAALRETEERYRQLVELSPDGIVVHRRGRLVFANRAALRLVGATREDQVLGRPIVDFVHPDFVAVVGERVSRMLSGKPLEVPLIAEKFVRLDGSVMDVEVAAASLDYGGEDAVQVIFRDVSDRTRMEEELRQAQKMEAIGRLAGGVAHDFNNLLQAMLSLSQVLRAHLADPAAAGERLTELEESVRRGAQLTRQLLLFSRRQAIRPERLDLNAVVAGTAAMLRRLLRENITIELALAAAELPVRADRGQLEQVVTNLALNAADAMPAGGRLLLGTARADGEGACLTVEDTGSGIPEDIRDRVFEPFFTTKGAGLGTGLGLSVVHGIVTRHGGHIELSSRVGAGSTFRIVLPHAIPDDGVGDTAGAPPAAEAAGGRGERVLVVEDEDAARAGLRDILTMLGYAVAAVGTGEGALALPDEPAFDLLLTDLMLPGLHGPEVARRLTARWPAMRVILMSGYAEEDVVRRGAALGPLRFLQKPFDMATLARELRAALDG